jgi:hypothetical protein
VLRSRRTEGCRGAALGERFWHRGSSNAGPNVRRPFSTPDLGHPSQSSNPAARHASPNPLLRTGKFEWVPNGRGEQPRRRLAVREAFSGLRPHPEVNSWPRKTAEFLGFSGPIFGQRDGRGKASWRREAHPPRTFFSLGCVNDHIVAQIPPSRLVQAGRRAIMARRAVRLVMTAEPRTQPWRPPSHELQPSNGALV